MRDFVVGDRLRPGGQQKRDGCGVWVFQAPLRVAWARIIMSKLGPLFEYCIILHDKRPLIVRSRAATLFHQPKTAGLPEKLEL
jgi:hypothetical protein